MNPSGVLRIQIVANGRQAQSQIAAVQRQTQGLNRTLGSGTIAGQRFQQIFRQGYMERWAKNLQWTGRQIEYNFTLPMAVASGFATKWYLEVESAMTRLRKVYGDHSMSAETVRQDTEKLGLAFELLSNKFGIAQSEVADIGATWAQAGAQGAQVARSTASSLELMILGEMEAAEATRALIAIQSQYQLSTQDLRQAVADLNAVENNTAVTLPDLVRVIERSGAAARAAGVPVRELAAVTASLVPASGTAERAGNALRTIITRLMVPTAAARDLFNEIGLEVDTAGWNSLNFTERLFRMSDAFQDLTTAQKANVSTVAAGVFQVSRFQTIMQDIQNPMGRYQQALDATADSTQSLADYTREVTTYLESDPQAFKILTARLQNLLIRIIAPLIPALLGLFSRVVRLVEAFARLDPRVQQIILGLLAMIAIVGPLVRYIGAFFLLFIRLGAGMKFMAGAAHTAVDALGWVLALLLRHATFPFDAVAWAGSAMFSAIGGAAAGSGRLIWTTFTTVHAALVGVLSALPGLAMAAWRGITVAWAALWRAWTAIAFAHNGLLIRMVTGIGPLIGRALVSVQAAYGAALAAGYLGVQRTLLSLQVFFSGLMARLPGMLYVAWWGVGTFFSELGDLVFKGIYYMMEGWLRFVAFVPTIWSRMWTRLVAITTGFIPFMSRVFAPLATAAAALPGIVSAAAARAMAAVAVSFGVVSTSVTAALARAAVAARAGMAAVYAAMTSTLPLFFANLARAFAVGFAATIAAARLQMIRFMVWLPIAWRAMLHTLPLLWAAMWTQVAAITRVAIPFIVSGLGSIWTAFVGLPTLLARIPRAFGLVFVALRVVLAKMLIAVTLFGTMSRAAILGFIRNLWLMPGAAAGAVRAVALAVGRGALLIGGALLSWPGMILAAVALIATIFRDQIGKAIDWLSEKFYDLPRAASGALRMVVDFFRSVARQIARIVRFIINPFAGIGGSSGPSQSAITSAAPDRPQGYADGGPVGGRGFGDTVPALLTPGEFVITRDGGNLSEAMQYFKERDADVVAMARGGLVTMQRVQKFQAGGLAEMDRRETVRLSNVASSPANALVATNTAEVDAAARANDRLQSSVDGLEAKVKQANRAIEDQQFILDDLQRVADRTRASLDAARDAMNEWANTPIEGMQAMSDAIFENEMAQKRLRLEMLRLEEANGPIEDVQDRLNALGRDIEALYDEQASLMSMGAGSDVLGVIDDRIQKMEAEYHQLENATGQADSATAKYEELEAQLEKLQRRGEMLNLEQSLQFDPLTRQIEQAANAMTEMPFETIIGNVQHYRAEVDRLTPIYERQSAAVEAQQQVIDDMSRSRDLLQRRLEDEKALLDEVSGAATDAVEAFRGLADAEDWPIPGGTIEGLEDLEGDLDSFLEDLQKELEGEFGNLELFQPIRDAWERGIEWLREHSTIGIAAVVGAIVGALSGLGPAVLSALTSGFTALPIGLGAFAGPLGLAIGAMLGVAVALAWDWFQSNVGWEGLQEWFDSNPLGQFLSALFEPIQEFGGKVAEIWRDFTSQFADELAQWGPVFEQAKGAIDNVVNGIVRVIRWLSEQFSTEGTVLFAIWNQIWSGITHIVLPFIRMIGEVIVGLFAIIRNVFGFIFALINGDWAAMWAYAGGIFTSIWDTIFGIVRGIVGIIHGVVRSVVEGVVNFFVWLYDKLVGNSIIPDLINGIIGWFASLPGRVIAFVSDMVSRVGDFFADMWNNVVKIMGWIRDGIRDRLASVLTNIVGWIEDIKARWGRFWDGLFTKVSEIAGTILEKIKALLGWNGGIRDLISSAVTAIGTLWDRIKKKFADPINFVIRAVYNNGIRKLWNFVAQRVGLGTLAEVEEIRFKRGGQVPGVGAMDTVPALLTPGEFVVRADGSNLGDAAQYFGDPSVMPPSLPMSMRGSGDESQRFAKGGPVPAVAGRPARFQGGGVVGALTNLNPKFLAWLNQWANAIQTRIRVTSGWRSRAEQARLYAQKPGLAAPPGRSNHEWGLAADIVPQLGGTYRGDRARDFNMRFPMSYEPWHIEPINARAMRSGGGGGVSGWLLQAVAAIADRILGPVRERVAEFRQQGPIQNMIGAASEKLMDAGVRWLREREANGGFMAPGGPSPTAADAAAAKNDRRSNVELGRQIAASARYGWTGGQWNSLYKLWQRESNWNHLARNPSSGAYGIPQSLPANKMASHGSDWRTNPRTQILWGADYIKGRYRTPTNALQAWYSRSPHWYAAGGPVQHGGDTVPAMLTPGEFVVDSQGSNLYEAIRYFKQPKIEYMAAGGPVAGQTVTASPGNSSVLQATEPYEDNSTTENHYHFGDLSFPNVRSGDDAEIFVRNLATIVGGSD